jgi:hypothetical protein
MTDIFCRGCETTLPEASFDANVLSTLHKNRHRNRAYCKKCSYEKSEDVRCAACEKWKPEIQFDAEELQRLKATRKMPRAICLLCTDAGKGRKSKTQRIWSQDTYQCMGCMTSLQLSRFDTAKLRKWVDDDKHHLIECESCESVQVNGPAVSCNLCKQKKAITEFPVARRQGNELKKWRCKSCDYAPCRECGKIEKQALHIPGRTTPAWTCQACLYPPCLGCGSARRKRTEMNRYNLAEYWCHPCIKKGSVESHQLASSVKTKRSKE